MPRRLPQPAPRPRPYLISDEAARRAVEAFQPYRDEPISLEQGREWAARLTGFLDLLIAIDQDPSTEPAATSKTDGGAHRGQREARTA